MSSIQLEKHRIVNEIHGRIIYSWGVSPYCATYCAFHNYWLKQEGYKIIEECNPGQCAGYTCGHGKMKVTVTLIDKPGSLHRFTEILEELNANIVHISYDRTSVSLDYGDANVTVHMETKGEEHQAKIRNILREEGYLRN